jgi:hypothetical protein
LFLLRRSLKETPEFLERKRRPSQREILPTLARRWRLAVLGTSLTIMNTVCFYMITAVRRRLRADRDWAVEFFARRAAFCDALPCAVTLPPRARISPFISLTSDDLFIRCLRSR